MFRLISKANNFFVPFSRQWVEELGVVGLIMIVLLYKVSDAQKLTAFNDDILFFVILSTSLILSLGMVFSKSSPEVTEESQFSEPKHTV